MANLSLRNCTFVAWRKDVLGEFSLLSNNKKRGERRQEENSAANGEGVTEKRDEKTC